MKLDTQSLTAKLITTRDIIARYAVLIFITSAVAIAGFLTLRIASLSNIEPSPDQEDEKLASIKSVRLDAASIEKLKELEDQNISVQSLFDNGRDNPFE